MTPPSGRATNPTAKVAKALNVPTRGSTFGKNRRLNTMAAAVPYRKKSYHSIVVPTKLARITGRMEWSVAGEARSPARGGSGRTDLNRANRIRTVLDRDGDGVFERTRQAIGPFDRGHTALYRHFVEAEVVHFDRLEAIEIHVKERQAPAPVFLNERKRRTADFRRIDAQPFCHSADERRFSCAQVARHEHNRAGLQRGGEVAAGGRGVGF